MLTCDDVNTRVVCFASGHVSYFFICSCFIYYSRRSVFCFCFVFFFFKQKTAYEMRISDWSSDVCSSDLVATATLEKHRWLLRLLGAEFGRRPVADITPAELLHELKKQERRGRLETAKQVRAFSSRVFRYAAATARAERDPAHMLLGALIQPTVKHFAAITDEVEFVALLRALRSVEHTSELQSLMRISYTVFCLKSKKHKTRNS